MVDQPVDRLRRELGVADSINKRVFRVHAGRNEITSRWPNTLGHNGTGIAMAKWR